MAERLGRASSRPLSSLRQGYPQQEIFRRKTPPATQESVNDALDCDRGGFAAIATTANASLISKRSTSPTLQPTLSSSFRIAGIGAVVNHCGSWLWVAWPLISARYDRPSRLARERLARTSAAAPSAFAEEAARVMVPAAGSSGKNPGILAGSTFSGCSSLAMVRGPAFSVTLIGAISALNAPPSTALRARVSVSIAYLS